MNCDSNQRPASGASGEAPVSWLFSLGDTKVGSHIRSNRLPSSFGMSVDAPSDSPGGLIQTNASRWDAAGPAGVAFGRSPIPAPSGLHQAPRWLRRSTFDWLT